MATERLTPSYIHGHTSTPRGDGDATTNMSACQSGGAHGPTALAMRAGPAARGTSQNACRPAAPAGV